jgi:hypothetical protein
MATLTGSASLGSSSYWSLKTASGLTWTYTRYEDIPELMKCHRFLERYCGPQSAPPQFQFPVILSLVARDETGAIVDGCYIEMVAEVVKLGFTKAGTEDFAELAPHLTTFMQGRKIRVVQVHARRRMSRFLRPLYERLGFKAMDAYQFFQGRI